MMTFNIIRTLPILILATGATVKGETFDDTYYLKFSNPDMNTNQMYQQCYPHIQKVFSELYSAYAEELAKKTKITVAAECEIDPSLKDDKNLQQLADGNFRRRLKRSLQDEQHRQHERKLPGESWCNNYCPPHLYLVLGCPLQWCQARRLEDDKEDEISNESTEAEQEAVVEGRENDERPAQETVSSSITDTSTSEASSTNTAKSTEVVLSTGSLKNLVRGKGSDTASRFYELVEKYVTDQTCKNMFRKTTYAVVSIPFSI